MRRLALLLAAAALLPSVAQAERSFSGAASALPLTVPGFETPAPAIPQMDFKPEEPALRVADCAVSSDQLPPEFIKLMGRLDAPVAATQTGLPPVVEQLVPAVRQTSSQTRRSHGIEILSGSRTVEHGRSRQNGVTVYRGLEPEQTNRRSAQPIPAR